MIENSVYIPYLQRNIAVVAKDIGELNKYAKTAEEIREMSDDYEKWHEWDGITQAYFETLDSLRRCEDAI